MLMYLVVDDDGYGLDVRYEIVWVFVVRIMVWCVVCNVCGLFCSCDYDVLW